MGLFGFGKKKEEKETGCCCGGDCCPDTAIDHVTDSTRIAAYGVMSTPALVLDGKVVAYGKVLKKDEVVKLLWKVRG